MEKPTPTLRILIADDHQVWTEGLALSLEQYNLQPVGIVSVGDRVLEACKAQRPDVLLLDINLPGRSGLEVLTEVRQHLPETTVLILTGASDPTLPRRVFEMGAAGFVRKSTTSEELTRQIWAAIARHSEDESTQLVPGWATIRHEAVDLTPTEVRVLTLVARGLDNASIAEEMFVSENTVKTHVSNLLAKLGVPNRTLAVVWAIRHGYTG